MSAALPPVLIVDDEKNMRLSLQTVLSDEGYAAKAVESAEKALELLEREKFLLLISDAQLGGMSGYDLLAQVRQAMARAARADDHCLRHAEAGRGGDQGRRDRLSRQSRLSRKNCCTRWRAARSGFAC